MLKNARPSEFWLGVILRAYDKAKRSRQPVTVSDIWTYICMEGAMDRSFSLMFEWDKSTAQHKNRVKTVAETIAGGWVPGLCLSKDESGYEVIVEETELANDWTPWPPEQEKLL